ncbi:MAG: hypothetical protein ACXW30_05475 [Micavibrio sp.]
MIDKGEQFVLTTLARDFQKAAVVKGDGLPVYTVLGNLESPDFLNGATLGCYCYRVALDGEDDAAVYISPDKTEFQMMSQGGYVDFIDSAIDEAVQSGVADGKTEMRILDIRSHYIMALWLVKDDGQNIFMSRNQDGKIEINPDFISDTNAAAKHRREMYEELRRNDPSGGPLFGG